MDNLQKTINQPIKNIIKDNEITVIEFEDGTKLPLVNTNIQIDYEHSPKCIFCGKHSYETWLCTLDDKTYICKDCTVKALETFGANGVAIDLNLSKIAPKMANKLVGQIGDIQKEIQQNKSQETKK